MSISHAIAAHEFMLSLEAGIIDRSEIIQWADRIILTQDYHDSIANVSMAANAPVSELVSLLSVVASESGMSEDDEWDATRRMLGRMHVTLLAEPKRMPAFTRYLEILWIRHGYEVPNDLHFIVGIEDDYQLAEQGQYGRVDEVRSRFVENLARFCS